MAAALALVAVLVFFGSALVGSFRPGELGLSYWPSVSGPRTDTAGVVAFAVLVVGLAVSEVLRVGRRRTDGRTGRHAGRDADGHAGRVAEDARRVPLSPAAGAVTGLAAAALVSSIALVIYLSVNALTHPATLSLQATHFASWPTEGTLRVLALAAAALATGWLRLVTIRHPGSWVGS
jgi:hypothetical protein